MKIGIITDIHENILMLREALRLADLNNCDELACLGDIVGFDTRFYRYDNHRSAKECLDLVKSNCRWIVAGNHDLFAAGRLPAYSNGFEYPAGWFDLTKEGRLQAAHGKVWCYEGDAPNDLNEDDIQFLKTLPEYIIIPETGFPALFSHYIFPDLTGSTTRYIERNRQLNEVWDFMKYHEARFSFSGHSHNHFAGFAYIKQGGFLKAIHPVPNHSFNLGNETVIIVLPPLTGEKARTGFSIIDTENMMLNIIPTTIV